MIKKEEVSSNITKGLFEKYMVTRLDGKPIKEGCIVLEWSDPNARVAIKAFSDKVRLEGYENLANDLDWKLNNYDN